MKFLTIVIAFVCFTLASYAQQAAATYKNDHSTSPVFVKTDSFQPGESVKPPGLRMRNTGRTLTIFGSALLIGGIVMLSTADDLYYTTTTSTNGNYQEGDLQGALGVLMVTGGVGMMVPGIIFWSKGSKKYKRSLEREDVAFGISGKGLGIQYRF